MKGRRWEGLKAKCCEEPRRSLIAHSEPPKAFDALLTQMDRYLDKSAPTPYREALLRVRDKVAANRNGVRDTPAVAAADAANSARLAVGKSAPDFVVQDMITQATVPLRSLRGRPVIMVFYQPGGGTARLALQYSQYWAELYPKAAVIGFSVSDDAAAVKRVHEEMRLTFPTLSGKALLQSYEVAATPRFVLLDAEGIVHGKYLGWGPETAPALEAELKKLLGPAAK